jgi:hypothetical protein
MPASTHERREAAAVRQDDARSPTTRQTRRKALRGGHPGRRPPRVAESGPPARVRPSSRGPVPSSVSGSPRPPAAAPPPRRPSPLRRRRPGEKPSGPCRNWEMKNRALNSVAMLSSTVRYPAARLRFTKRPSGSSDVCARVCSTTKAVRASASPQPSVPTRMNPYTRPAVPAVPVSAPARSSRPGCGARARHVARGEHTSEDHSPRAGSRRRSANGGPSAAQRLAAAAPGTHVVEAYDLCHEDACRASPRTYTSWCREWAANR